jgi:hypothetical protein
MLLLIMVDATRALLDGPAVLVSRCMSFWDREVLRYWEACSWILVDEKKEDKENAR